MPRSRSGRVIFRARKNRTSKKKDVGRGGEDKPENERKAGNGERAI